MIKLITFRWLNISNNKKHLLGFVLCCKGLCLSLPPARTSVWQNREGLVLPISFSSLVFAKSGEIAVFVCSISSSEDSFLLFKLLWKTSFGSLNFETAIFHVYDQPFCGKDAATSSFCFGPAHLLVLHSLFLVFLSCHTILLPTLLFLFLTCDSGNVCIIKIIYSENTFSLREKCRFELALCFFPTSLSPPCLQWYYFSVTLWH